MDHNLPKRFLNLAECAAYLGRTHRAIYALVHSGQLPYFKPNNRLLFEKSKIDQWVEKFKGK